MAKEEKLDWIYKGANSLVDREEYLLGRKVDKTLDQINQEEKEKKFILPTPKNHVEHECIPPSIRDFNKIAQAEQVDLSAKLQEDPLVAIKKREEEARRQFLQNPVQLKKLQEALQKQQNEKKKHKKSKRKHSDLDEKLKEKLRLLKSKPLGTGTPKKDTENALNTILMHKFNALKDKLSEEDLQDILNGKVSDDSDEDKSKKKKIKEDVCVSDNDTRNRKSKKNRDSDISKNTERKKKRDRSSSNSSSDSYDDKIDKSPNRRKREYSLDKKNRNRAGSSYRNREKNESYIKESSIENKYKNRDNIHRGRKVGGTTSQRKRSTSRRRKSRSSSINSRSRSSSCERTKRIVRKNRSRGVKDKHQEDSKLTKQTNRRERSSSSESNSNTYKKSKDKKDDDSDLDEKIMAKLRILRGEVETKIQKNTVMPEESSQLRKKSEDSSSSSSDDDKYKKKTLILPAKLSYLNTHNRNSDSSSSKSTSNHSKLKTLLPEKPSHLRHLSNDTLNVKQNIYNSKNSDSEEELQHPKSFGLVTSDGKKIALKKAVEHQKVDKKPIVKPTVKPERKQIKKLTEQEKERLREEMMRNAKVRDKEREKNVKRYRENEKKEEEMVVKKFDADLVHTKLLKSAKHSSVEQRIKSNLNNIQRSSRHMDSNFSKR